MSAQKRYFPALDGIRGIAALSVVMFHLGRWLGAFTMAPNASLAVDLFFCLSGYVLMNSYKNRFDGGMTPLNFIVTRCIRLIPVVVFATLLSAVFILIRARLKHEGVSGLEVGVAAILGLVNIPFFGASNSIGGPQLFPLNGPQYTIFLEFIVNIVWFFTYRLKSAYLHIFILSAALIGVCFLGLGGDNATTFWNGFPRVFASFYLGVVIYHVDGLIAKNDPDNNLLWDIMFWLAFGIMILIFFMPFQAPFVVKVIWIAFVSPVIVLAGARSTLNETVSKVALWLGAISYPVYLLQYPLFGWLNAAYQTLMKDANVLHETVLMMIILPAVSYIVLRIYDEPVRSLLSRMARAKRPAVESSR